MKMFAVEFYTVEEILYIRKKLLIKEKKNVNIPIEFFAFFFDADDA